MPPGGLPRTCRRQQGHCREGHSQGLKRVAPAAAHHLGPSAEVVGHWGAHSVCPLPSAWWQVDPRGSWGLCVGGDFRKQISLRTWLLGHVFGAVLISCQTIVPSVK